MPRHSVCLVNGHDAELLSQGVALKCSEHKHIDRRTAQLMASGTSIRPFLDPDYDPLKRSDQKISEPYKATAAWAMVRHLNCDGAGCIGCQNSGKVMSEKHLVIFSARNWQVINGSQQYAILGSARQSRKRGRTHQRMKFTGKRGPVNVLCQSICRPSLLRRHKEQTTTLEKA